MTNGVYCPADTIVITNDVILSSVNGAAVTIVDGQNARRCLYIQGLAVVNGLTFRNGSSNEGGGVYCNRYAGSGGTLNDCVITGCSADTRGGGVFCYTAGTLSNCTITGNSVTGTADTEGGGGVFYDRNGKLINCTITSHSAVYGGGVLCWVFVEGEIRNCTISGNSADYGGGIAASYYYDSFRGSIDNCTISFNTADIWGGGVYFPHSITLNNSLIVFNSAAISGGGAFLETGRSITALWRGIQFLCSAQAAAEYIAPETEPCGTPSSMIIGKEHGDKT